MTSPKSVMNCCFSEKRKSVFLCSEGCPGVCAESLEPLGLELKLLEDEPSVKAVHELRKLVAANRHAIKAVVFSFVCPLF